MISNESMKRFATLEDRIRFLENRNSVAASLRFSSQIIPNDDLIIPVAADETNGATWADSFGDDMILDIPNSKILFSGTPEESVVEILSWWAWQDATKSGDRQLVLNTTGGGTVVDNRPGLNHATNITYNYAFNVRRMAIGERDFNIQVWQDSGGDLVGNGLLVVIRIR